MAKGCHRVVHCHKTLIIAALVTGENMPAVIGVIGGGQLAAMLAAVCRQHGSRCLILDPDGACPAVLAGGEWFEGDSWNLPALSRLANACDVLTVEIEHVHIDHLRSVAASGCRIIPDVEVLAAIVNKHVQKQHLAGADIPTSPFVEAPAGIAITSAPFDFPLVWKASRGGYDGRGVRIINNPADLPFTTEVDGFIEAHVDATLEIAVMVAVSTSGETTSWSPVEMVFDAQSNMLDFLAAPARISAAAEQSARELAIAAVAAVNGVGLFGVEMFLDHQDQLSINEISPRSHNSGHFTMDAAETSQFEQQYRILTGQPLGPTAQHSPAVMVNLLGHPDYEGDTVIENLAEVEALPDTHVHLYGKRTCFPKRKMGHATLTAESVEAAMARAGQIKDKLIIRGNQTNA